MPRTRCPDPCYPRGTMIPMTLGRQRADRRVWQLNTRPPRSHHPWPPQAVRPILDVPCRFSQRARGMHAHNSIAMASADRLVPQRLVPRGAVRFWEQDGSERGRAGAPECRNRGRLQLLDQPERLSSVHPLAGDLCCGPACRGTQGFEHQSRFCNQTCNQDRLPHPCKPET